MYPLINKLYSKSALNKTRSTLFQMDTNINKMSKCYSNLPPNRADKRAPCADAHKSYIAGTRF